jgi:hypothetical protein
MRISVSCCCYFIGIPPRGLPAGTVVAVVRGCVMRDVA